MQTAKAIVTFVVIGVVMGFTVLVFNQPSTPSLVTGSVTVGNEYHSTTTDSTWNVTPYYKVLATGNGTLGSVVITLSSTARINLYDATSTVTNTEWATTTLAKFGASATSGTYTFDTIFRKGLLVEVFPGAIASTTITWRSN